MTPDSTAVLLKLAVLVAVLQAAGGVLFLRVMATELGDASAPVLRLVRTAAMAGIVFGLARPCLEAARFAGDFAGVWDVRLQRLAWQSRAGLVQVIQIAGLASIVGFLRVDTPLASRLRIVGAVAAAVAFTGAGHTSVHHLRGLLMPLLAVHTLAAAFWFGSLAPLLLVVRNQSYATAVRVLVRFSRMARWSVAGLAIAGLTIAVALSPGIAVLSRPYGEMLTVKFIAFTLLLVVIAFNHRRGMPDAAQGREHATQNLQRSIALEVGLVVVALTATAALTTLFSPDA